MRFVSKVLLAWCAALLTIGVAAPVAAQAQYEQTLQFYTAPATSNAIVGLRTPTNPLSIYYATVLDVPANPRPFNLTIPDRFTQPLSQIFYLSTDVPGNHLLLGANTAFSATLVGREFTSVFTDFNEAQLINALKVTYDPSSTPMSRNAATSKLADFAFYLQGVNGGFGSADAFTLTSFSTGTVVGSGLAAPKTLGTAVPEPHTWLQLLLGFGLIGWAMRRRAVTPRPLPSAKWDAHRHRS